MMRLLLVSILLTLHGQIRSVNESIISSPDVALPQDVQLSIIFERIKNGSHGLSTIEKRKQLRTIYAAIAHETPEIIEKVFDLILEYDDHLINRSIGKALNMPNLSTRYPNIYTYLQNERTRLENKFYLNVNTIDEAETVRDEFEQEYTTTQQPSQNDIAKYITKAKHFIRTMEYIIPQNQEEEIRKQALITNLDFYCLVLDRSFAA